MRTKLAYKDGRELPVEMAQLSDIVTHSGVSFVWYEYADHIAEPNGQYNEATVQHIPTQSEYVAL